MKKIASVTPIREAPSVHAGGKPIVSASSGGVNIEELLKRDRWDRPLILQPDGTYVAYRRASSIADVIESYFGLHKWELRLTAQGFAQRPDLLNAVLTAKTPKQIGDLVDEAMDAAGRNTASRNGSTVHSLTDLIDQGGDLPPGTPPNIVAMVEKYVEAMKDFEYLDGERFVVQDKIKVAGTYDRRLLHRRTGKILIGDIKTGQKIDYHTNHTPAQVAVYASAEWYDLDGERESHGADHDLGLLIHLPWVDEPQFAECNLHWMDLRHGRAVIKEALRVEKFQKMKYTQTLPSYKG